MKTVFIDTGAFYAALNKKDTHHQRTGDFFFAAKDKGWRLITSNFVIAETHALILNRLGREAALLFLKSLPTLIVRATEEDEQRGKDIIFSYADKNFSYCDAVSFAIIERLSIKKVLAFDVHFKQYGKFHLVF